MLQTMIPACVSLKETTTQLPSIRAATLDYVSWEDTCD